MHERHATALTAADPVPDSVSEREKSARQVDHLLDAVQVSSCIAFVPSLLSRPKNTFYERDIELERIFGNPCVIGVMFH